jgi:hypothetical protein
MRLLDCLWYEADLADVSPRATSKRGSPYTARSLSRSRSMSPSPNTSRNAGSSGNPLSLASDAATVLRQYRGQKEPHALQHDQPPLLSLRVAFFSERQKGRAGSQNSPDLNPIERAFSKLKAHLRKAAERTIPRLSRRIGALVAAFSPRECTSYFRHAGYAST